MYLSGAFYDNQNIKSVIGLFTFPNDPALRKKGTKIIYQLRRKGGLDSFNVIDGTVICEFHSKSKEIKTSLSEKNFD